MSQSLQAADTLIVGCGDTGSRVAQRLLARGNSVLAVVRTEQSRARLKASLQASLETGSHAQLSTACVDLDNPLTPLPAFDRVVYLAPPARQGEDDARLAGLLAALQSRPAQFVYISTSGVYGDCGGAWVDEDHPLNPQTDRARRRVAAEQRVMASGLRWCILRVPGIYGPGRIPRQRLAQAEPVLCDADSPWTNRIHVSDLAQAILALMASACVGRIYNVSDGRPTRMAEQYRVLARLTGQPAPPEIDWQTALANWSQTRLSFLRDSRRLLTERLQQDTGWRPDYPELESGLRACLADDA